MKQTRYFQKSQNIRLRRICTPFRDHCRIYTQLPGKPRICQTSLIQDFFQSIYFLHGLSNLGAKIMKNFHYFWITASPIANTTDILPFILHIPNYSCINNQKSPLPWYRIEIKTLPLHWQNPPASRKICGLNGAFCKLDIQHKSITTGEQIDTQKLLILQWK